MSFLVAYFAPAIAWFLLMIGRELYFAVNSSRVADRDLKKDRVIKAILATLFVLGLLLLLRIMTQSGVYSRVQIVSGFLAILFLLFAQWLDVWSFIKEKRENRRSRALLNVGYIGLAGSSVVFLFSDELTGLASQ
jgi:fatty acid desaturase